VHDSKHLRRSIEALICKKSTRLASDVMLLLSLHLFDPNQPH
jgi:hypothetical protein